MTIIDNMLKMKKMNGLKIFALVLLSLSKFETMFGMEKNEKEDNIDDDYVNKNYYLIDDLRNKITLDDDGDIKFKIYLKAELEGVKGKKNEDIFKISEEGSNKILTTFAIDENDENKEIYSATIAYINGEVIIWHKENNDDELYTAHFPVDKKDREEYKKKAIPCNVVKKIGEDSMNDDYILVDAENNKIEKINDKNIVFKLLTRKKYLELKGNLNDPVNFLKNEKNQYILDNLQKPLLFFEEEEKDLILYVKRIKNKLYLAWVLSPVTTINFTKDNSIKVRMAKKEEILKVKEEEKDKSSKCCCGIC